MKLESTTMASLMLFMTVFLGGCLESADKDETGPNTLTEADLLRVDHGCSDSTTPWLAHGGEFRDGQAQYPDLNGDDRADLMFQGGNNRFYASLANGDGSFSVPREWMKHGGDFKNGQAQYADFNGDGKDDLIFRGNDNRWWVSLSQGCGFGPVQHWLTHGGPFEIGQTQYPDFNGDGKADVIFRGVDNRFWLSLSTGSGFTPPRFILGHGGPFIIGQTQYADVNGDNKDDVIFQGVDNRFWVSISDGNNFSPPAFWVGHGGPFLKLGAQYPDVNGDGMADLAFQGTDNRFWISLSSGGGFSPPQLWVTHGGNFVEGQAHYADVNGDNRDDLVFQGNDNRFWVSTSAGNSMAAPHRWYGYRGNYIQGQAQFHDLNADGMADIVFQSTSNVFADAIATGTGFTHSRAWENYVDSLGWSHPTSVVIAPSTVGDHNDAMVVVPGGTLLDTNWSRTRGYKEAIQHANQVGLELYVYKDGNFSYLDYWDCVSIMSSLDPCRMLDNDAYVAPWPQYVIEKTDYDESLPAGPLQDKADSLDAWNVEWNQPYYGAQIDRVRFRELDNGEVDYDDMVDHVDGGDSALHTGYYLASQAFRYHVTKSPQALANAKKTVRVLSDLLRITGGRGYIARYRGPLDHRKLIQDPDWCSSESRCHLVTEGPYAGSFWLGHTSRDMYKGWMFGMTMAYDLIDDEDIKAIIRADMLDVVGGLRDNGWTVQPSAIDPYNNPSFSSLDSMSFAMQGYHVTGNRQILFSLKELIKNYQREIHDLTHINDVVPSNQYGGYYSNQLEHMDFFNILRLGKFYLSDDDYNWFRSFFNQDIHTYTRLSHAPFLNMVYMSQGGWQPSDNDPYIDQLLENFGDLTGAPAAYYSRPGPVPGTYEVDVFSQGVDWIRQQLLGTGNQELIDIANSVINVKTQAKKAFPIRLQCDSPHFQRNPFQICDPVNAKWNQGAHWVESGQTYLVPYWMARYYGFISKDHGYNEQIESNAADETHATDEADATEIPEDTDRTTYYR